MRQVREQLDVDPNLWMRRPIAPHMLRSAATDVAHLLALFRALTSALTRDNLTVTMERSALYSRCYSVDPRKGGGGAIRIALV
jgi:ribonuclease D